jgi:hypothetical protein
MVCFSKRPSYISIHFSECHLADSAPIVISPLAAFSEIATTLS